MAVLNDFEANGYGVTAVSDENLVTLNDVPAKPKARPTLPCCESNKFVFAFGETDNVSVQPSS